MMDKKCVEISVEDPSVDFQKMKDSLDKRMILDHGFFKAITSLKGKTGTRSGAIN